MADSGHANYCEMISQTLSGGLDRGAAEFHPLASERTAIFNNEYLRCLIGYLTRCEAVAKAQLFVTED